VVTRIVCILLTLYWFVLFIRILMSWFPGPRSGAGRVFFELVHDVTEPVLRLVRGLLPPIRMGGMGMDLSPIIVFVAISILRTALNCSIGL
jgi:YggT family protein